MKIYLSRFYIDNFYFEVISNKKLINTSKGISDLFNLDMETYNQLLIDKVIKHEKYDIEDFSYGVSDLSFNLNGADKETYLNVLRKFLQNSLCCLL